MRQGGTDAATWTAAALAGDQLTEHADRLSETAVQHGQDALRQAQALTELASATEKLEALDDRWGGTDTGQFAGRLHEWWAETTFNSDAITQGDSVRARMTEFASEHSTAVPHDPADLRIYAADGSVLQEIQSKAVASDAARLADLAREKYSGMGLHLPADHVAQTESLIDRRIGQADPEFLKRDAYESVRERVTDRISHGDVESTPVDSQSLRSATADSSELAEELVDKHEGLQRQAAQDEASAEHQAQMAELGSAAGAAAAGGLTAAALTATISGVRNVASVRAQRMSPTAAALSVAADSASAFARGSFVGGAGQSMKLIADHTGLPDALGSGAIPFAIARASLSLGQISLSYARGDIEAGEAAAQSAESLTRISFVLAASTIGQAAIPIPVVGMVVGGMVGSVCATIAINGFAATVGLAKEAADSERLLAEIEVQVAAALIVLDEERRVLDEIAKRYDIAFNEVILPSLDRLDDAVRRGDYEDALLATSTLIVAHSGDPLFSTVAEFHEWMSDPFTTLTLNPNPGR